jgi:hypothetical protein
MTAATSTLNRHYVLLLDSYHKNHFMKGHFVVV